MYVKDLLEVLQSLPPTAEINIVTADSAGVLSGGVFYPEINEVVLINDDTALPYDEGLADGKVVEFGEVSYYYEKGKSPEELEDEYEEEDAIEMALDASGMTKEMLDAFVEEARERAVADGLVFIDPRVIEGEATEVPDGPSCEEDADGR